MNSKKRKKNPLIEKWSEDPNRQFSKKKRHTNGQQVHEKMLNITNNQGKQIEITVTYDFTPIRMVLSKREVIVLLRMWRKRNPCTLLVGM